MELRTSDIVESLNGRDAGMHFFVIRTEEGFAWLADGKRRRLEKPKLKKVKHLRLVASYDGRTAEKLRSGEKVTNSEIRRALAAHAAEQTGEEEVC